MEKKKIRVSDAIPQRPASFDDAVERTLASVTKKEQQKETPVRTWKTDSASTRKRGSKRSVLDIVAIAAIFVICIAAIGTVIGLRSRMNRTVPADQIAELPTAPVNMSNTVYVSTVDELLAALAPDTRIVLADGTYDLTTASDYGTEGGEYYTWEDRSDNWFREPEENSFELCLQNLQKCCITGSRNAEIVTVPRTAAVLYARNCSGLVLSGFTAGHTVMADPCEGEVIRLVECPNAWVENCSLYGCGTWGVDATDCNNLKVVGCDIHECSSGGVAFVRCHDTLLSGCALRNCGYRDNAFSIVYIYDCKSLRITGCDVYENRTDVLFNLCYDENVCCFGDVLILGTSVHDNEVLEQGFYSNTNDGPIVAGCEFKNNDGVLLSDEEYVFDRKGNRLNEADLLAMQLDRTLDAEIDALSTLTTDEKKALCVFVDGDREYEPYVREGIYSSGPVDVSYFLWQMSVYRNWIPTIQDPSELTVKVEDGVKIHNIMICSTAASNTDGHDALNRGVVYAPDLSYVQKLPPGTYYVGQAITMQSESGIGLCFECIVKIEITTTENRQSTPITDKEDALCLFVDGDREYEPFIIQGVAGNKMSFLSTISDYEYWIPTIQDPSELTVKERNDAGLYKLYAVVICDAAFTEIYEQDELNTGVVYGTDISEVQDLAPGSYYVSQRISRREADTGMTYPYECIVRIEISATETEPQFTESYYLVNNVPFYPFEHFLWESRPDLEADGMGFEAVLAREEYRQQIPEAEYDASVPFEIVLGDGWTLDQFTIYNDAGERIATVGRDELPLTEYGCAAPDCVTSLSPGVYYVSATVANRGEEISRGNGLVICLLVREAAEAPEPGEEPSVQESSAVPSTFRFWDYDEENGYSEAPEEGVLFVCDLDGDGTENEIRYEIHGSSVTFSVGKASIDVEFGAGLEQAILLDLDPDSARQNLLVVYNTGSEDYETAELHMENGRFVRGPVIFAYCSCDGDTVRGSSTQTDILGTKTGERTYHGEDLTPDSEWYDCDVIPDDIPTARDREHLIENGKLLHLVRDLPCTIDGEAAVIPAGSYIYMTRWHDSWTLAEIRTEDGTVTALVTVERADENDPELYGYLIDGVMQYEYFDNIFFAD